MPAEPPNPDRPPMAIPLDDPEEPSRLARLREVWTPAWRQTRRNLRVWIPWLATRRDAACRVRVPSRDHRTGLTWEVKLPRQCWYCGNGEQLDSSRFNADVRAFENPLQIIGVTISISAFFLLLTCLRWEMAVASLLALLIGAAVLILKSWHEKVRLIVWSCAEHQPDLQAPEMVIHEDDLTLTLGSESLSQAMREQLKALRKVRPGADGGAHPTDTPAPRPAYQPQAPRPAADLPKIKLAGDEEEEPA